jgi:hypothetical protein
MNPVQYAIKLAYDAGQMKDTPGEEKYKLFFDEHPDFTKNFPLVVKYFCLYGLFSAPLFQALNTRRENERPELKESLVMQAEYIKKLLVGSGVSKAQAKKISNQELGQAESQLNKIKNQAREIKKKMENEKKDHIRELRRELLEFVSTVDEN